MSNYQESGGEPQRITDSPQGMVSEFARLVREVKRRKPDVERGPVDDTLRPEDPGHPEFHRRQRAELALSRWRSAVPYRYRNATASRPEVQAWADRAAADIREAGFLVLTGGTGTGKTHEAYGALRRIAEAGTCRYEAIAITAPDMYGLLRPNGSERGSEVELKRLCRVPLLLLDDLGTEKLSDWTEEAAYRIVNYRYNESLPMLITTNLPVRSDNPGAPDVVARLGERLTSRLSQVAVSVKFTGPDRRPAMRPPAA